MARIICGDCQQAVRSTMLIHIYENHPDLAESIGISEVEYEALLKTQEALLFSWREADKAVQKARQILASRNRWGAVSL